MVKFIVVILIMFSLQAHTAERLRVVIFPIKANGIPDSIKSESWLQIRGRLSKQPNLVVATYNFLNTKKVFQPRAQLATSDSLLLGRLLQSDLLITVYLDNNTLKFMAYDSKDGLQAYEKSILLSVGAPYKDQLVAASVRLVKDFIGSELVAGPNVLQNKQKPLSQVPAESSSKENSENNYLLWGFLALTFSLLLI